MSTLIASSTVTVSVTHVFWAESSPGGAQRQNRGKFAPYRGDRLKAWHASHFSGRCPEVAIAAGGSRRRSQPINKGSTMELREIAGRSKPRLCKFQARLTHGGLDTWHRPIPSQEWDGCHAVKVGRRILDTDRPQTSLGDTLVSLCVR